MNSAQRIREVLQHLRSYGGAHSTAAMLAWRFAFHLDEADPAEQDDLVVLGLQAMRSELGSIMAALESAGVPDYLYVGPLGGLRKVVQPMRMADQWQGVEAVVRDQELSTVLGWAGYILPQNEEALEESSLSELLDCIAQLEQSLERAPLAESTRAFMSHQADLLRRAVLLYPVTGAKGIKRAMSEAMGQAMAESHTLNRELAEGPQETQAVASRWGRMMSGAAKACDLADKLNKAADAGVSLAGKMGKLFELIPGALDDLERLL